MDEEAGVDGKVGNSGKEKPWNVCDGPRGAKRLSLVNWTEDHREAPLRTRRWWSGCSFRGIRRRWGKPR